jgi:hypothetical protein
MQIQRTEEERNSALEKIQVMEHVIQQSKSMEAQWQAAEEKANALAGIYAKLVSFGTLSVNYSFF